MQKQYDSLRWKKMGIWILTRGDNCSAWIEIIDDCFDIFAEEYDKNWYMI